MKKFAFFMDYILMPFATGLNIAVFVSSIQKDDPKWGHLALSLVLIFLMAVNLKLKTKEKE